MTQSYKLAVFEQGQGEPLVMLHGLISTHRYWNQVIELIDQAKWRVISLDLLGFGDSPKPKDGIYDLSQQVASVDEAIASTAKPPYTVVGHSMGAITALKWAVDKPELFSRLILTSMPLLRPETVWQQLASIADNERLFKRKSIAKAGVQSFAWLSILPARVVTIQKRWPKHVAEDWTKHSRTSYKKTLDNIVFADELLELLQQVKLPVHLVIGNRDGMIDSHGVIQLTEITKKNKNFIIQIIDAAHNLPLEHPEIVARAILRV